MLVAAGLARGVRVVDAAGTARPLLAGCRFVAPGRLSSRGGATHPARQLLAAGLLPGSLPSGVLPGVVRLRLGLAASGPGLPAAAAALPGNSCHPPAVTQPPLRDACYN